MPQPEQKQVLTEQCDEYGHHVNHNNGAGSRVTELMKLSGLLRGCDVGAGSYSHRMKKRVCRKQRVR